MREPAVGKPEPVMESLGVDDKRVAFPLTHGMAEVQWIFRVPFRESCLFAAVEMDETPVLVTPAQQDTDSQVFRFLDELHSVRTLKNARAGLGLAIEKHGIVFQKIPLPEFIEVPGPLLKRSDAVDNAEVAQYAMAVSLDGDALFDQRCGAWKVPVSSRLTRWRAQPRLPVWPSRRWRRGLGRQRNWFDVENSLSGADEHHRVAPNLLAPISGSHPVH